MARQHVKVTVKTKQLRMPKLALNTKKVTNGKRKA